jgi:hypothetical protein
VIPSGREVLGEYPTAPSKRLFRNCDLLDGDNDHEDSFSLYDPLIM